MPTKLRSGAVALIALAAVVLTTQADQAFRQLREFCGGAAVHRGVPAVVGRSTHRAAYTASLWATPDVGTGRLYVVIVPRDGVPFVPPRDVRIHLQSEAGDEPAREYQAYPERVRHGARFVTAVALPRVGMWRARVVIDGASGSDDLRANFASVGPSTTGPTAMLLSATPFVLVAGLWVPWRRAIRRRSATSTRLTRARST